MSITRITDSEIFAATTSGPIVLVREYDGWSADRGYACPGIDIHTAHPIKGLLRTNAFIQLRGMFMDDFGDLAGGTLS